MKKTVFSLLVVAVLLPGCAVYTPSGSVVLGDTGTRAAPASAGHGGGFCPPGQAKKGNC